MCGENRVAQAPPHPELLPEDDTALLTSPRVAPTGKAAMLSYITDEITRDGPPPLLPCLYKGRGLFGGESPGSHVC